MTGITIKGTGRYLPERIVTNDEFAAFLDTSDEWIRTHTGIERRRFSNDEPVWYMGSKAVEKALAAAGTDAAQVDLIIGATASSEYRFPSIACLIQETIGAANAFCMDISAGCAGGTFGLDVARRYLSFPDISTVLLVGSERLSQVANYEDRTTCPLFGDGAGAVVLTKGQGVYSSFLHSDGTGGKHLYARLPGLKTPFSSPPQKDYTPFPSVANDQIAMAGHDVYRFATRAMPRAIQTACDRAGILPAELDLVIPHQANIRIIEAAAKHMKLPMEKVYVNIQDYGNTSAASVLIGLDECIRAGRLQTGNKVCIVGFGAGLNYGAVVFEYKN